jgi:hypothetical protein
LIAELRALAHRSDRGVAENLEALIEFIEGQAATMKYGRFFVVFLGE